MKRFLKLFLALSIALALMTPVVLLEISKPVEQVWAQGGVTAFTSVRVARELRLQPRTAVTLTSNGSLNPSGSNQRIQSAGAVGLSGANITVKPAGSLLILTNVGANTITFTETGTLISAGNVVLGAGDTVGLLSDGVNWTQIFASNN